MSELAVEWNKRTVSNLRPSHLTGEWISGVPELGS